MSIRIPIVSDFDSKGIDKAVNEFKSLEGAGAKAHFAIKKAAIPAAAALTAVTGALGAAAYAAMEDQKEQAALALTLSNVTGATAKQTAGVEDQITAMSKASGITDTEYRKSLENLVRGTKDVSVAMKDMTLVMDISTATGMDSASVADALAKAYQGNFKALRTLSPEMASMIKDGASLDDVMKVLGDTFGGATADSAKTAAGQMKILKNSLSETSESIGYSLMPVIQAILPIVNRFASWAQDNPKAFLAIAAAIGVVAAAIIATNIAMALNPFSLIAAGIALLIVALGAAYAKFEWFRTGVDFIINGILGAFENMVNGAIMAVNAIIRAYNAIPVLGNVSTIGHVDIPTVGGAGKPVDKGVQIPKFAQGGIVTGPTLAMIGDGGGPEAVIPLSKLGNMGGGITVNVNGGFSTSAEIGQAVVNALRAFNRAAGPASLSTSAYL